ncbi:hypothetical protein ACFC6L_34115 [Kitasatospora phosalacinea]
MCQDQSAQTGAGVLVIGGLTPAGWWMAAVAAALIAVGVLCVRIGFRRER